MKKAKILISLPSDLSIRFKAMVPPRQRSEVIHHLLEDELSKREKALYKCAATVEADQKLNDEISDWDNTLNDGLDDETW